jgi:hypothetical protein
MWLLHRHTLCQIPRLIDCTSSDSGNVIGKELEGDGCGDHRCIHGAGGDLDDVITGLAGFFIALGDDA